MKSYIITCPTQFRDRVLTLARQKSVSVSDLALAALTFGSEIDLSNISDPGDASADDRETVVLQSGPRKGRTLRRKPRLQLRLPPGYTQSHIRRCLALHIEIANGDRGLAPEPELPPPGPDPAVIDALRTELDQARERAAEMRTVVSMMAFEPLPDGVRTVEEARYVLGLPPTLDLTRTIVKARFRLLSQIYHPDKETGDTARMAQLIEASRFLEARLKRSGR